MKIVKPSFDIWERDEQRGGLAIIERAGRICYKSEPGKTPESAEKFARGLIKSHHNSVLEHGDMIFEVNNNIYEIMRHTLNALMDAGEHVPMLNMTRIGGRCIVSGNIRAWRELFAIGESVSAAFIGFFDPVFVEGYGFVFEGSRAQEVRQVFYKDIHERNEKLVHLRQTVHIVCDRAIQNEFVRHRTMSFSVESTRYVDYSNDKYDVAVIEPCFLIPESEAWWVWKRACLADETAYDTLRRVFDRKPQESRSVLNLSTKTEMVITGSLRAWDHFFDLRARTKTGQPHPQAVELAAPLMSEMTLRFPDVFGCE